MLCQVTELRNTLLQLAILNYYFYQYWEAGAAWICIISVELEPQRETAPAPTLMFNIHG
jgi:hypothetical protein